MHGGRRIGQVDVDFLVVELTLAQFLAEGLSCGIVAGVTSRRHHLVIARWRKQNIENAFFGSLFGAMPMGAHRSFTSLLHGDLHQIADDRVHILAHVADFGEFSGLHLDERCTGQPRQAAGDFSFSHTGWPDHENVLWRDFGAELFVCLLAAPAVAQGNRDGALGVLLSHNVAVKFGNDFLGSHGGHGKPINCVEKEFF